MWPVWGFCPCTGPTEIQVAWWFLKDKPVEGPRGAPGSTQLFPCELPAPLCKGRVWGGGAWTSA